MAYDILTQIPESPVKEEWSWTTDTQTSYDGHEDRIALNKYPKRLFGGSYKFESEAEIRQHLAVMFSGSKEVFSFPLFQYQAKLKLPAAAGASSVTVNALRSDLRVDAQALIIEGSTYELLTVDAVTATVVTFTTNLVNSYSARAVICPIVGVYSNSASAFTTRNPNGVAEASFKVAEYAPLTPFVDPLNEETLTTFDSLPVLDKRAMGTEFAYAQQTGLIVTDYIGMPDLLDIWDQPQKTFPLQFLCNHTFDITELHFWRVFGDYCLGSSEVFLIPTFRNDLLAVGGGLSGGSTIDVEGHLYSLNYWGLDTYSRIVIDSDAGRHYAKITAVASIGGNDRLSFTPALPVGAGWDSNRTVSFLLKARIADDKILLDHFGLHTEVTLTVRTVT